MSGGERQRLLLAQALIGRPQLLFLDEPLISLDPPTSAASSKSLGRAQQELGITVLFTAHELNPLLGAIDRVLYLGGGNAVLGTVDEVITGPVLSRLYGTQIEVVRLEGRIFVMAGGIDIEREAHRHDHADGHGHDHREADPMLDYDFMRVAFAAAGVVAFLAGMVGFSSSCAARPSPATRSPMSASPAPRARR